MNVIKLSIIALISFMLCWSTYVSCIELSGDHICHKQENYTETINATKAEPVQVRKNFWCIEKIRCSEMQPDTQEVVHVENVTRSRVVKFCCPDYEEFEFEGKKICKSNATTTTTTIKPLVSLSKHDNVSSTTPLVSTEKNPYMNYSGEYGKDFNHYMKMGINETDIQQSINKLVEMEIKKAREDYDNQIIDEPDGYIFVDVTGNEIEPLKHPQYVTDHHLVAHHEETVAMVTVGCLIFGMCIFLMIMVYILRKQQLGDNHDFDIRDVEVIDPKFESRKSKLPPSKIIHEPLPIPPLSLRPSLRKHKSVTFDESIDEVDEFNRRRTRSLPDAYDIPRKQTSMIDLYAECVKSKITPKDVATYALSQISGNHHTFPKKNVSRKQSLEHIYDEIPTITAMIKEEGIKRSEKEKNEIFCATQFMYANELKKDDNETKKDSESEKTKM